MNDKATGTAIIVDSLTEKRNRPQQLIQLGADASPMQMLALAVQQGADPNAISRLMDLRDRFEATEARKAFVVAMAEFKQNPPRILKDKLVHFQTASGTTSYMHARLGTVCQAIIEGLSKVGISHRWDFKQEAGKVTVACILTHRLGHSESISMESPVDTSGSKNAIQAIGSAQTYLNRYTLLAITGLATNDMPDDDGAGTTLISESQLADLLALIDEHKGNKDKLLRYFKLESFEEIAASNFESVCKTIRSFAEQREQTRNKSGEPK